MLTNRKEYAMSSKKVGKTTVKAEKVSGPKFPDMPRGGKVGKYEQTANAYTKLTSLAR